ncbi:MAG: phytanoyl-CoA dioxygenase family protein [Cystobacter sp.]
MTSLPGLGEPRSPDETSLNAFHGAGHVQLREVFSSGELSAYRPALREYILSKRERLLPGEQAMGASAQDTVFSLEDAPDAVRAFVTAPRLGELASRMLGVPAVRLLHFTGFFKAGGGPPTPWHQDLTFIPLDCEQALSVWIPLTDLTPDMGGLVFASGSHRQGLLSPSAAGRFTLARNGPMRAGDISVHMGWTLHASLKNTSPAMREAIAVCYYADGARIAPPRSLPFSQRLLASCFSGLSPGEPAAGPLNPVVFRRSDSTPHPSLPEER